jgi:diacylglycerol kinase family enzyme
MRAVMIVLLNASAGSATKEEIPAQLAAALQGGGAPARVEVARSGDHLCHLAREAAAGPEQLVVAGGGDGTVSAVASTLVGTGKVLGVLPLGTLNHFAKDLGIPLKVEDAVATLLHGEVTEVDAGEVNGQIFINNSSIGLYPEIVRRRDKEQQRFNRSKWPAMVKAFFSALRDYRFVRARVRANGTEFLRTTPFVFVGNNPYDLDGFGIGGRAQLNTGMLCCWLARGTRPLGILRLGARALFGRLRGARDFEAHCGSEFEVVTPERKLRVALDGETRIMDAPLHYRSRHGALRVMAPARAAKN